MYDRKIGVSILTNGARLEYLKACISSFLSNCYYRPLVVGVFDNGSTDGTKEWLRYPPKCYGVEWRMDGSDKDLGCAAGTNRSCAMVKDCEFSLHLESDFGHVSPEVSGEDRLWLRRAVEMMLDEQSDYLYLRKMVGERDIFMHWWSQWMGKIDREKNKYLRCPGFWWSNNPSLFRNEAMYSGKVLPLDEAIDGPKGSAGWSKPELSTARPQNSWIHRWGLFVHELYDCSNGVVFSEAPKGCSDKGCKYGFFVDGCGAFCSQCDREKDFRDMQAHAERYRRLMT